MTFYTAKHTGGEISINHHSSNKNDLNCQWMLLTSRIFLVIFKRKQIFITIAQVCYQTDNFGAATLTNNTQVDIFKHLPLNKFVHVDQQILNWEPCSPEHYTKHLKYVICSILIIKNLQLFTSLQHCNRKWHTNAKFVDYGGYVCLVWIAMTDKHLAIFEVFPLCVRKIAKIWLWFVRFRKSLNILIFKKYFMHDKGT